MLRLTANLAVVILMSLTRHGTASPQTTTLTFQQGPEYSGTLDTQLVEGVCESRGDWDTVIVDCCDSNRPSCLGGSSDGGSLPNQGLLQFSNIFGTGFNQIPLGSTIQSATLTINIASPTADEGGCLHRMLSAWTEDDTWCDWVDGIQPDGTEAAATACASVGPELPVGPVDPPIDVRPCLQAWSDGASNHGWAILPGSLSNDGWEFSSSEASQDCPLLTVTFVSPPPIPTVSGWGLVVMSLVVLTAGTLVLARRRRLSRVAG